MGETMKGDGLEQGARPEAPAAGSGVQTAVEPGAQPEVPAAEPYERVVDGQFIAAVVGTGLLTFSGTVIETAMNVTFPTLMEEFGVGTSTVQWLTSGYLAVIACVIALSSYLKHGFKTLTLHLASDIVFAVGVVLCILAPNFPVLLIGRLLQGVGLGIALPLMFNIILEQAPLDKMGLFMGVANLITGLAPAFGPALGGFILDALGWRWIFIVMVPVLLLSFVLGVYGIRQVSPVERARFPLIDYLLLVACFACVVLGVNSAADAGWLSAQVLGLLAGALVAGAAFVARSLHAEDPLIRIQVFFTPAFTFSVLVILCVQFITLSVSYLIPNYVQLALGTSSFISGLLLLPGCVLSSLTSPASGNVADRIGFKAPILVGNAFILAGTALFACLGVQVGEWGLAGCFIVYMIGVGSTVGNTMTNGLNQLPDEIQADGNAVINTLQQLAGALGSSVASSILSAAQVAAGGDMVAGSIAGAHQVFVVIFVAGAVILCCSLAAFWCIKRGGDREAERDGGAA